MSCISFINASNINSEAPVRECSKRKFFLKKSLELTVKELCAGVSFMIKIQPECLKPNVCVHIIPATGVFQ